MLHLDHNRKLICELIACLLIKAHVITITHLSHEHLEKKPIHHNKQDFFYCLLHAIFYHPISNVKAHLETTHALNDQ